jgi:DNA-binding response OmpR family regulator
MSLKVLVIDDDPMVTEIYNGILTAQGFEVFLANSGPKGLEAMQKLNPDVIVLDLMMPGMNGWEVCQQIRTFSQAPILMITAVVDPDGVMRALEAGADDYLIKPTPGEVIAARIRRLARRSATD